MVAEAVGPGLTLEEDRRRHQQQRRQQRPVMRRRLALPPQQQPAVGQRSWPLGASRSAALGANCAGQPETHLVPIVACNGAWVAAFLPLQQPPQLPLHPH